MNRQYAKKLLKAAKGAAVDIDATEPSMILVGDGGKDPAAEEYVFVPPGNSVIIAPKMSAKEKPSMSGAVKAVAKTALKKAQYGAVSGSLGSQTGSIGSLGGGTRASRSLIRRTQATGSGNDFGMNTPIPAFPDSPIPGGPSKPAAPYDPGVGRDIISPATSLMNLLITQDPNPMIDNSSDRFAARPGSALLAAKNGAISSLLKSKLKRAQYGYVKVPIKDAGGQVVGYQTMPSLTNTTQKPYVHPASGPSPSVRDSQQFDSQRYSTDASKAIAQMQVAAQERIAGMTNAYNMQRLALDRMLGQQQIGIDTQRAQTDKNRAIADAQQLMMTRAGRQMNAPGGNVIPSLQPLIGRTIN